MSASSKQVRNMLASGSDNAASSAVAYALAEGAWVESLRLSNGRWLHQAVTAVAR